MSVSVTGILASLVQVTLDIIHDLSPDCPLCELLCYTYLGFFKSRYFAANALLLANHLHREVYRSFETDLRVRERGSLVPEIF